MYCKSYEVIIEGGHAIPMDNKMLDNILRIDR